MTATLLQSSSTHAKHFIYKNEKSHIPFNVTTLTVIMNTFIIKPFPFGIIFLKKWIMLPYDALDRCTVFLFSIMLVFYSEIVPKGLLSVDSRWNFILFSGCETFQNNICLVHAFITQLWCMLTTSRVRNIPTQKWNWIYLLFLAKIYSSKRLRGSPEIIPSALLNTACEDVNSVSMKML